MMADNQERTQASLDPERNGQVVSCEKTSMINRLLIAAVAVLAIVCVLLLSFVNNHSRQYENSIKELNEKLDSFSREEEELSKQVSILQEKLTAMTEEVDKLKEIVGAGGDIDAGSDVEGERDLAAEEGPGFFDVLPDDIEVVMWLDVYNVDGYVRGFAAGNDIIVSQEDLEVGEYYSPAIVVCNNGDQGIDVVVQGEIPRRGDISGTTISWDPYYIDKGSNLAFRVYENVTGGTSGDFEIIWFCNNNEVGEFRWRVE